MCGKRRGVSNAYWLESRPEHRSSPSDETGVLCGTDGDRPPRSMTSVRFAIPRARTKPVVGVPSRFVLEFNWRGLRLDEDTWSGSEVNRLIGEFLGQALPSVYFAHRDLT